MTRYIGFFALLSIAVLGGCAGRGGGLLQRTTIQHPMTGGGVAGGAPLVFREPDTEQDLGIQAGTLDDQATLVRADAEQVCFDVTVRVPEGEEQWANLTSYRIQLLSTESEAAFENPMVSGRPVQAFTLPGTAREQIPTGGQRTYCAYRDGDGLCQEYRTEPIMRTIRVPTTRTVYEGGGLVCWANQGILSPSTTWLRMRLVDPENPGGRRGMYRQRGRLGLNYEWHLSGAQQVSQNSTSGN